MKVSFDFDGTLQTGAMQELAKKFVALGAEVWITTTRHKNPWGGMQYNNQQVWAVAEMVGIPKERIQFTEGKAKYAMLKGFDIHFDDDSAEIEDVNNHPRCGLGFLYEYGSVTMI